MTDPYARFGTTIATPQSQPAPGRTDQVQNNAGGFVFEIDPLAQFRRFLTIGSAGGTYYVGEDELTRDNMNMILAIAGDETLHFEAVHQLVQISLEGRAPKQNPTFFALAVLCQNGTTEAKQHARSKITEVCRTGTHLFTFMKYLKQWGGINRGLRREIGKWYTEKDSDKLAYQLVKYRQREGWTHRDVLRQVHPKVDEPSLRSAINWTVHGLEDAGVTDVPATIWGFEAANMEGANIPSVLREYTWLPWEALPDSAMNDPAVWEVLLNNGVPLTALIRQLPRLTNLGLIAPLNGGRTEEIAHMLINQSHIERSRIHPMNVLVAQKTYAQGHGMRSEWRPEPRIIDALDEAFYLSFKNVEPSGKRTLNALDVSGSMGTYAAGRLPLTAREVSGVMAMMTVRTEQHYATVGFTSNNGYGINYRDTELRTLPLTPHMRLDDVMRTISGLPFGGTDCALPMQWAEREGLEIDTFVIYTDNETWAGRIHPHQALQSYRRSSGIDAKLVVVACTPTKFSIADPKDPGMLDISGFDSATPSFIADFSAGRV